MSIADIPTVNIEIISINIPGINSGGEIDTTTMANATWRTRAPKALKSLDPVTAEVSYATDSWSAINTEIGNNQLMTITAPDTTTFEFYGYVDTFVPGALEEGSRPTATLTIIPTLRNASDAETAPVYSIPSGAT